MRVFALPLVCCLTAFLSCACCGREGPPLVSREQAERREVDIEDPSGPIPAPVLPPELARADKPGAARSEGTYAYDVDCELRQGGGRGRDQQSAGKKDENSEELVSAFLSVNTLSRLQDTPPQSLVGLQQRLSVALNEARDVLRSQGYYSGRVRGWVEPGRGGEARARVRVTFFPGPRYTMGQTRIVARIEPVAGDDAARAQKRLPASLEDVGLAKGAPARAADVLAAVDRARDLFPENGYPFARVERTRYIADHQKRELEAEVHITPGAFARMGGIVVKGEPAVRPAYIEAMRVWRKGRPWRQSRLEAFRESLRQSGLFQSIDLNPADAANEKGERDVVATLVGAPERTLSGAVKYHSDFGPGVLGAWEHRNLTGRGDSLRITAPLWLDMQEIAAAYRLPFFLRRDQDFIANTGFVNQDTEAYRLTSAAASAGLERRLSRHWRASVQGSVQGGSIKEPDEASRDYYMFGLPVTLNFDNTGSLLDAAKGARLMFSVSPYSGEYNGYFSAARGRAEGRAFVPLAGGDELILALRGVLGAVGGEHSDNLPPSIRFYSGGGGSVRGYEYQSIGPRDEERKPKGGGSLVEMSTEARLKITKEWGLVAFVDGGTAYKDVFDEPGREMRWGAGAGLRYYTVIGPVRMDIATPLNPRKDDDDIQFYLSIGQSF
jgi:translocation and assembly module TamA